MLLRHTHARALEHDVDMASGRVDYSRMRLQSNDSGRSSSVGSTSSAYGGYGGMVAEEKTGPLEVVFLGAAGVGKTAIVQRFLFDKFPLKHTPTVEDIWSAEFRDGKDVMDVNFCDTSGTYSFPTMVQVRSKAADVFVLVYSVDDAQSFAALDEHRRRVLELHDDPAILVVGNKIDVDDDIDDDCDDDDGGDDGDDDFATAVALDDNNAQTPTSSSSSQQQQHSDATRRMSFGAHLRKSLLVDLIHRRRPRREPSGTVMDLATSPPSTTTTVVTTTTTKPSRRPKHTTAPREINSKLVRSRSAKHRSSPEAGAAAGNNSSSAFSSSNGSHHYRKQKLYFDDDSGTDSIVSSRNNSSSSGTEEEEVDVVVVTSSSPPPLRRRHAHQQQKRPRCDNNHWQRSHHLKTATAVAEAALASAAEAAAMAEAIEDNNTATIHHHRRQPPRRRRRRRQIDYDDAYRLVVDEWQHGYMEVSAKTDQYIMKLLDGLLHEIDIDESIEQIARVRRQSFSTSPTTETPRRDSFTQMLRKLTPSGRRTSLTHHF